jgi:ATP-binding cassette, subfamily B, bacterial
VSDSKRSDRALYLRAIREARPYWPLIGLYFVIGLLSTPLSLLTPVPLKIVTDSVIGDEPLLGAAQGLAPEAVLALAALLLVCVALLTELQGSAAGLTRTYAAEKLILGFRARIFRHVQRLSAAYHDSSGTADSTYRMMWDANAVSTIAIDSVVPIILSAITALAMLVIIFGLDAQIGILAIVIMPALVLSNQTYRQRIRPGYKQVKKLESSALGVVQEVLTSLRVVKAFGNEDREHTRFLTRASEGLRARLRISVYESAFSFANTGIVALGTGGVLYLGATKVLSGAMTLGDLILILGYVGMLYGPITTITKRIASLQSSFTSAERAYALLDEAPDVPESSGAVPLKRATGAVSVEAVSYVYPNGPQALDRVSFSVPAGSRVGIVGPTGAGKTTLVSLLTRFADPTEGRIVLDGVDLRDYRLSDLRGQFGVVLQEPLLFSTTLAENIAYARDGASFEEIVEAAKMASAHDFISALPDGYDTLVGERGMRLSGGERQRVSLARAFLKDAPILVLDEPTSSVDNATESQIMEAMERLMAGRTAFMIAHRLSTVRNCDIWVRLDHGRLTEATTAVPVDVKEAAEAVEEAQAWVRASA